MLKGLFLDHILRTLLIYIIEGLYNDMFVENQHLLSQKENKTWWEEQFNTFQIIIYMACSLPVQSNQLWD